MLSGMIMAIRHVIVYHGIVITVDLCYVMVHYNIVSQQWMNICYVCYATYG